MSIISRFLTSFRDEAADPLAPGLIQNEDGTVSLVGPDGAVTPLGASFEGWTVDDNDPASVASHGGSLDLQAPDYTTGGIAARDGAIGVLGVWGLQFFSQNYPSPGGAAVPSFFAGSDDPTAGDGPRDPRDGGFNNQALGSLYIRVAGGVASVWVKTGGTATDWRQLAFAA